MSLSTLTQLQACDPNARFMVYNCDWDAPKTRYMTLQQVIDCVNSGVTGLAIEAGDNITLSGSGMASDPLIINATDTNTQLTDAQVEAIVEALFGGIQGAGDITVTGDFANGFVVSYTGGGGNGSGHPAANITNNNAPFSFDPATQLGNIPTPSFTIDPNTGELVINPGDGTATVNYSSDVITKGNTPPDSNTSTANGFYWDTANNVLYVLDGGNWNPIPPAATQNVSNEDSTNGVGGDGVIANRTHDLKGMFVRFNSNSSTVNTTRFQNPIQGIIDYVEEVGVIRSDLKVGTNESYIKTVKQNGETSYIGSGLVGDTSAKAVHIDANGQNYGVVAGQDKTLKLLSPKTSNGMAAASTVIPDIEVWTAQNPDGTGEYIGIAKVLQDAGITLGGNASKFHTEHNTGTDVEMLTTTQGEADTTFSTSNSEYSLEVKANSDLERITFRGDNTALNATQDLVIVIDNSVNGVARTFTHELFDATRQVYNRYVANDPASNQLTPRYSFRQVVAGNVTTITVGGLAGDFAPIAGANQGFYLELR